MGMLFNQVRNLKTRREEDVYDQYSDGFGVLCVPKCIFDEGITNPEGFEINVPTYYFDLLVKQNKVELNQYLFFVADFYYDSFLGAIFDPEMVEKLINK